MSSNIRQRPLGQSGIEASAIGLGAWAIGGWMWGGTDERDAIDAIQASIDSGITLIDTAPAYGMGRSEQIVGKAIAGRRDQVVLATKCGLVWETNQGTPFVMQDGHQIYRYLGPESVKRECEQSLRRLGTDHIDLYQTHWQDATTPIAETMGALLDLKREGKIRAIGVSNASLEQIEEYRAVGPVDTDQEKYSMLDRNLEAVHLPYLRKNAIAFLAYSPLANGLLSGKMTPSRKFSGDDLRRNNARFSDENREWVSKVLSEFEPIAQGHSATIAQVVIAWTLEQPGVTHALVGARNRKQAEENAPAGNLILSAEELKQIVQAIEQLSEASAGRG
jgi:aryl-alcohol dehydrogenase-like predicted oxidoreductase